MSKKILAMLLAVVLAAGLLPGTAWAADGDFVIRDSVLMEYNGPGGAVTIPDGVTSIKEWAFSDNRSITSVTIPNGVTSIGDAAFHNCTSLTSVTIPASVISIGDSAFSHCESRTSVVIPDGVTSIGDKAFSHCGSLTSVVISDGVTSIGYDAFDCCTSLTSVVIPASVTSIGDSAFFQCYSLTSVTILDGVTSIGATAFGNCYSLTSVTIPNSVTFIGANAFSRTSWLESLGDFATANGILLAYQGNGGSVVIPNGVTSIGDNAFFNCGSLTSVVIPNSVTSIGDSAFYNCYSLTGVVIPASVTSIGSLAFVFCDSLTSVVVPASVTSIGNRAFNNTPWQEGLGEFPVVNSILLDYQGDGGNAVIPGGFTYINDYAFSGCDSLTSVIIPDGVTSIGEYAFGYCANLTSVTIPASVTSIGRSAFLGSDTLTDIYYDGSESQWKKIDGIDYASIRYTAIIHYVGTDPEPIEPEPTEPETPEIAFNDVPATAYYAPAVVWALENKVTEGATPTTFNPNSPCTRAQIVTFLWRAYGEQEPTVTENPFTDVKPSDYYYKAVLWAVENGVTEGTTPTTFGPGSTCTRNQAVTFQYRAAKEPPVAVGSTFTDVASSAWYAPAVAWALENGITEGATPTTFNPNDNCTRAQIVTFLYREMG